jgi:hypothetical protein
MEQIPFNRPRLGHNQREVNMEARGKVLALDFRTGVSTKEGKNKDKSYVSYKVLDMQGNFFDLFSWANQERMPVELSVPCLIECKFEVSKRGDNVSFDLVQVEKMSEKFDLEKVLDKIHLVGVGESFKATDKTAAVK